MGRNISNTDHVKQHWATTELKLTVIPDRSDRSDSKFLIYMTHFSNRLYYWKGTIFTQVQTAGKKNVYKVKVKEPGSLPIAKLQIHRAFFFFFHPGW